MIFFNASFDILNSFVDLTSLNLLYELCILNFPYQIRQPKFCVASNILSIIDHLDLSQIQVIKCPLPIIFSHVYMLSFTFRLCFPNVNLFLYFCFCTHFKNNVLVKGILVL